MGIGSKLDILITSKGRKVNDVARAANVPASTVYSIIKRDNTKADLDDLQRLAKELGVTLEYFVDGYDTDSIPSLADPEHQLLDNYRQLNPVGQRKANDYLDDLVASGRYAVSDNVSTFDAGPISIAAHARTDIEVTDEMREHDLAIMLDDDF